MNESNRAVFLSYASEDAAAAQRICDALRAAGIEVWFDQSALRGGDAWDRQIRHQIHHCALFIALISAHSNARTEGYFRREWRLAVERTHDMADDAAFLLPVVIDDTPEPAARVPDPFRAVQWTRLPGGETSPTFVERVRRLLATDWADAVVIADRPATTRAGSQPGAQKTGARQPFRPASARVVVMAGRDAAGGRRTARGVADLGAIGPTIGRHPAGGRDCRRGAAHGQQRVRPRNRSRCCPSST